MQQSIDCLIDYKRELLGRSSCRGALSNVSPSRRREPTDAFYSPQSPFLLHCQSRRNSGTSVGAFQHEGPT